MSTSERITRALRRLASALPETDEGIACAGTAIEKCTYRARGRAFLFLGAKAGGFDVMVKLGGGLAEAQALAGREPSRYRVGAGGWVTATFAAGEAPPPGLLERWIAESHQLFLGAGAAKKAATRATKATSKVAAKETAATRKGAKKATKAATRATARE